MFIRLSTMHSNSFSSHECCNFQTLKQNNQFMSANNPRKTNQPTHPPLIQKENTFKMTKIIRQQKIKPWNQIKVFLFHQKSHKNDPLLQKHKPQTEIICKTKTQSLNDQKNFLFHKKWQKRSTFTSTTTNPKRKSNVKK